SDFSRTAKGRHAYADEMPYRAVPTPHRVYRTSGRDHDAGRREDAFVSGPGVVPGNVDYHVVGAATSEILAGVVDQTVGAQPTGGLQVSRTADRGHGGAE